jgi:hypothetical protein
MNEDVGDRHHAARSAAMIEPTPRKDLYAASAAATLGKAFILP